MGHRRNPVGSVHLEDNVFFAFLILLSIQGRENAAEPRRLPYSEARSDSSPRR